MAVEKVSQTVPVDRLEHQDKATQLVLAVQGSYDSSHQSGLDSNRRSKLTSFAAFPIARVGMATALVAGLAADHT